jgi:hypothetical protein
MAEPTSESTESGEPEARSERVPPTGEPSKKRSRRGRMRRIERAELQAFFDDMVRALVKGDGRHAAELFDPPAYLLGDENAQAILTQEEIVGFFTGAKEQYTARGIADTRAEIVRLDRITSRLVMVTLRYPWLADNGSEIGEERASYIIQRGFDGGLKIRVALMRGFSERAVPLAAAH